MVSSNSGISDGNLQIFFWPVFRGGSGGFTGGLRFPQVFLGGFAGNCVHFCGGNVVVGCTFPGGEFFPLF
jgi:hypothetical protein